MFLTHIYPDALQLLWLYPPYRSASLHSERPGCASIARQDNRHHRDDVCYRRSHVPHVGCGRTAVGAEKMDPLLWECHHARLSRRHFRIRPGALWGRFCESPARVFDALWFDLQLALVHQNFDYPLFKQNRLVCREASAESVIKLLWRLQRRRSIRRCLPVSAPEIRLAQYPRRYKANLHTLYLRDWHQTDQVCHERRQQYHHARKLGKGRSAVREKKSKCFFSLYFYFF